MAARSFRHQLFLTIALLLLAVLGGSTCVALLVARNSAYEESRATTRERIEQLSRRALFPVLVGGGDRVLVKDFLNGIAQGQDVLAVELLNAAGLRLGAAGSDTRTLRSCEFDVWAADRVHVRERAEVWCAAGPVYEGSEAGVKGSGRLGARVGQLRVVSSAASLRRMMRNLVFWNLVAGGGFLALGVLLAWQETRRLTDPLRRLAGVMHELREGRTKVRAALEGPREMVSISSVFNDLLTRLEEEAMTLESKVKERTRELHEASEAALGAERYKSAFMTVVTHEMKTPLHVIRSYAMDISNEIEFLEGSEAARGFVDVIVGEVEELLRRLYQILDLARAEAGRHEVRIETFELEAFCEDIRRRSLPLAREHKNELHLEADDVRLSTDRDKLQQIVSNLVANACKFTRGGLVVVSLRSRAGRLEIVVSDNGCGIAKADQELVWQDFRQAEMNEARTAKGFGLGLAIVKRFTEILGGTAQLESEPGTGTTVRISIPLQPAGPR